MNFNLPLHTRSIRFQLLLAVNLPLAVLATLFLVYDFRREILDRVVEKRIALDEEAKTMLPAVLQMRHHGKDCVQSYIDTVCARMQDSDSPGHHIAVVFPEAMLQAEIHHRASPEMIQTLQQAAQSSTRRAYVGEQEIIVGNYGQDGTTIFVSETMERLRRSVWNDLGRQIVVFLILACVAAIVVNVVLLRFVTAPLRRLVNTVRDIAAGKLGSRAVAFSSAELRFLANEINQMSEALTAADRYRGLQMAKAREIQQHVLPDTQSIPGLTMASLFLPADEVGGDYYDVISLSDGTVLLCVADVTGHGVSAAMATVLLRSLLHTAAESLCCPREVLDFVNRRFEEATLPGDFATVILVQIDVQSQRLEYASAGHETALLLSPDGERRALKSTGLILGIDADAIWESQEYDLAQGERLLLVTDGVTETHDPNGTLFGRDRLVELLETSPELILNEFIDRIKHALAAFQQEAVQHDDVTIVLAALDSQTSSHR